MTIVFVLYNAVPAAERASLRIPPSWRDSCQLPILSGKMAASARPRAETPGGFLPQPYLSASALLSSTPPGLLFKTSTIPLVRTSRPSIHQSFLVALRTRFSGLSLTGIPVFCPSHRRSSFFGFPAFFALLATTTEAHTTNRSGLILRHAL